jgi:hypothetical protein
MGTINRQVTNAFLQHYRKHNGASPQKLILTREQAEDLLTCQRYGAVAIPGAPPPRIDVCRDRPLEISDSTVGEVVAVDGAVTPLSDYEALA